MFYAPDLSMIGFDYCNATELEEIQQNLIMLYGTAAGTCPGDRSFGLDQSFESYPINVAQNLFALEVIEKTEMYENRVEVLDVDFEHAEDGSLMPKIIIGKRDADDLEETENEEEE